MTEAQARSIERLHQLAKSLNRGVEDVVESGLRVQLRVDAIRDPEVPELEVIYWQQVAPPSVVADNEIRERIVITQQ